MKSFWDIEQIRAGFARFKKEHGHYPTGPEMDRYDHLPSSRQIQRRFGGLRKLRSELGLETTDFGRGIHRSKTASRVGARGREWEDRMERLLVARFGEIYVHREQPILQKVYADFVVYAKKKTIAVDVFTADSLASFVVNLRIKLLTYKDIGPRLPLRLVCVSNEVSARDIEIHLQRKKSAIPGNVVVQTWDDFFRYVETLESLEAPDGIVYVADLV